MSFEESEDDVGSIDNIMLQLDIEGQNAKAKVMQYLIDARSFLQEQQQKAGLDINIQPTPRERQLLENYAVGKYTINNTKSHSEVLFTTARADIRTHISAIIQNKTEDDIATGNNQFRKTAGNPGRRV